MLWDTLNGVLLGAVSLCPPVRHAHMDGTDKQDLRYSRRAPRKASASGVNHSPFVSIYDFFTQGPLRLCQNRPRSMFGALDYPARCLKRNAATIVEGQTVLLAEDALTAPKMGRIARRV
jgi:hypothetical protein